MVAGRPRFEFLLRQELLHLLDRIDGSASRPKPAELLRVRFPRQVQLAFGLQPRQMLLPRRSRCPLQQRLSPIHLAKRSRKIARARIGLGQRRSMHPHFRFLCHRFTGIPDRFFAIVVLGSRAGRIMQGEYSVCGGMMLCGGHFQPLLTFHVFALRNQVVPKTVLRISDPVICCRAKQRFRLRQFFFVGLCVRVHQASELVFGERRTGIRSGLQQLTAFAWIAGENVARHVGGPKNSRCLDDALLCRGA